MSGKNDRGMDDLFTRQVDETIERVGENAGEQWGDEALDCVLDYSESVDTPFLTEDVREAFSDRLIEPHDGRAWGHVMRRAARLGAIRKAGYASARSSNGTPKVLWEPVRRL